MPHGGPHHPMGPYGGSGGGAMAWAGSAGTGLGPVWTGIGVLILLVVAVTGMYLLLTRTVSPSTESDATRILRQRYATGEIDEAEFDQRMARLSPESPN